MFNIFKKKSEREKLYDQYNKLLQEAHKLSITNRRLSDQKIFDAEAIMVRIENLN
ncbi:Lacal_2735 family protein [Urechidicola vernalis]|uniref:Lacal_2735 family protein n=1 Tax=Urechidicola vernalis TaxID=3075600 RepID=A0ABU2Y1A0_9FLAO|nr:Lacal_2735 family protein [Urechidicola sp. P050]MDT0551979.1 Lacal_2735 family protein [Urechidicola sp. P050]